MKRLPVTSIFIGGDRDEGEGVSLYRLAGAQLLDNDAAEGGRRSLSDRGVHWQDDS